MARTVPSLERRELHYEGHVQGVGFRYSVVSIARRFIVVGFVRNLMDGRVQLIVEGKPTELDQFLGEVAGRMGDYIRRVTVDISEPNGEFSDFSIRF
jgi:acylphosphatase